MTKPFDPTKPAAYRKDPHIPVHVVVLPRPTVGGETLLSIDCEGDYHFHFRSGAYCKRVESIFDLMNIPERVEIEAWALYAPYLPRNPELYLTEDAAKRRMNELGAGVVVRLTGSYER